MESLASIFSKYRVVPVVAVEDTETALPLADALLDGGLGIIEVTFRTQAAAEVIQTLVKKRPELYVGAGTVLTAENLTAAVQAGAQFGVAPGFNPDTVTLAQEKKLPFMPGIATPTEIEAALAKKCEVLKFFPAETLGGTAALKAVSAPYRHTGIQFVPTGGVNESNFENYLELPNVAACGGTWLVSAKDIAEGNWKIITQRVKRVTGM